MKNFKPILAPNKEVNLDEVKYPILASYKLDGIRCIFYKGQILSRSLKPIVNKQLKEKFEPIRKYSEDNQCIFDGEIYSPELTFQEITSYVMTKDLEKSKKGNKTIHDMLIPHHLKFYCFDFIHCDEFEEIFVNRQRYLNDYQFKWTNIFQEVVHFSMGDRTEVEKLFDNALKDNCEGLILRDLDGRYKCGRGTIKEGIIYKVKPYRTFDAEVIGVVQSTVVDPIAEKKTNELGRSVTSKKKDDRILIEKASAFNVLYEGKELKVVLAMTDEEKEEIWKNRDSYIGRMIEYKGMIVGAKNVPRHPVMIRFRCDKDK